jgi:two-component system, NtrC family, sensor histidine kinase HydH
MNQSPFEKGVDQMGVMTEEEADRLRRELDDLRNFMESIFQSIGSGIILTGVDDIITYINRAGEKILGGSKEMFLGRPFSITRLKEKTTVLPYLLDGPDGIDTRKEGWMTRREGVEFPVGYTINDHLNVRGEVIGKIAIFRDLTKVYRIQEEMLRMDRLVSLGELASGIAHELRNPLAGIKTTAQALGEELPREDSRREYLSRITKEIDRLNDLLKTFFSFAKPQRLNLAVCHVRDIVNEIIPFLIKEIADKGIRFEERYHPDLPRVKVDKSQMHQVFLNLFLNAIQAMPNGGLLSIEATPHASQGTDGGEQESIKVVVSDTGKGIPPHLTRKIFDPFFTTKPRGVGLGLSITYQIIKKHGGTIKVDSKWGEGTSFILRLAKSPGES